MIANNELVTGIDCISYLSINNTDFQVHFCLLSHIKDLIKYKIDL